MTFKKQANINSIAILFAVIALLFIIWVVVMYIRGGG